jgi:hypothetical protein
MKIRDKSNNRLYENYMIHNLYFNKKHDPKYTFDHIIKKMLYSEMTISIMKNELDYYKTH